MRTIVAPATPMVPSAIGVVRMSGPQAFAIAKAVFGSLPPARTAALRCATDAQDRTIDQGLVLVFPGPHSYTGDDVVEFQGHGSPAAMAQIIEACQQQGAVLARPGEFTERAFRSGKIDLSQAEAVADLIHARSQRAARSAAASLTGAFRDQVAQLQADLTRCRVRLEANLDFPEEEDVDPSVTGVAVELLQRCHARAVEMLAITSQTQRVHEGLRLALLGPPNVGKSSLLNALAGDELAIVSDVAGTTRDRVLGRVVLSGVPIEVVDTAGLRHTNDPIELQGIERSRRAAGEVDVVIWLGDASGQIPDDRSLLHAVLAERADAMASATGGLGLALHARSEGHRLLCVLNKSDCRTSAASPGPWDLAVSAKTQEGLDHLRERILALAGVSVADETSGSWSGRERHRAALAATLGFVAEAIDQVGVGAFELAAENCRLAQMQLSFITGEMSADDLLGEIFSSFCIGK